MYRWMILMLMPCGLLLTHCYETTTADTTLKESIASDTALPIKYYQQKATDAYAYCQQKKLNKQYCVLIDLGRHSGLNRFFVWNFLEQKIIYACLVSHGCYQYPWSGTATKDRAVVSNAEGSHASSVGKYIIGARGASSWGIGVKYLLHGKDSSNKLALQRAIVLHGWEDVPLNEVYPAGTPEGWGCPAIANDCMRWMDSFLKQQPKPMLLWAFQE